MCIVRFPAEGAFFFDINDHAAWTARPPHHGPRPFLASSALKFLHSRRQTGSKKCMM
jgi:hypothetical protein